jgi:hypothetical protein
VTTRQPDPAPGAEPERGFVLAAPAKGADAGADLAELRELARTAGVEPVDELVQHRERPDPRTYVGKGKLAELQVAFKASGAESLIVDDELSPVQQRRLEDALQSWRSSSTTCRGCAASGSTSSGSAAASAREGPARASWRPTAAWRGAA